MVLCWPGTQLVLSSVATSLPANGRNALRHLIGFVAFVLAACASQPAFDPATPPLILTGEITRADHLTYRELAFTPPPGTGRITIDFAYTGKDKKTVIDIGLRDPEGQRGWSGGNKSHIEIGELDATPSYRPGRIQQGEWKLVLGIPNIRDGQTATYTATIKFAGADAARKQETLAGIGKPLSTKPGWFRGDFHMHTAHSDGSCDAGGQRQPCPTFNTADAARDAKLDFVAITDHNTITQLADIRRLQKDYPKTLLIPGTEVTTFFGHANVIGNSDFVDFQLGSDRLPTLGKLFDEAAVQGAIVSINHPSLPSGEICMGCGWTAKDTAWSRVTALEVINGSTLRTGGAEADAGGIRFWENLLNQGYRITAIGGSDNHDATDHMGAKQSPIGRPTTAVHANALSTHDIIAGVKSGRAFVDAANLPGATLDLRAELGGQTAVMGGTLKLRPRDAITLQVLTTNLPAGAKVELVSGNNDVTQPQAEPLYRVSLTSGAKHGWVRANVRDASGRLLLLGNPVYLIADDRP